MPLDLRSCSWATLSFCRHITLFPIAELLSWRQVADAQLFPASLCTIVNMDLIHDLIVRLRTFHQETLSFGFEILTRDQTAQEGFEEGVVGDGDGPCLTEFIRGFLHTAGEQWKVIY